MERKCIFVAGQEVSSRFDYKVRIVSVSVSSSGVKVSDSLPLTGFLTF